MGRGSLEQETLQETEQICKVKNATVSTGIFSYYHLPVVQLTQNDSRGLVEFEISCLPGLQWSDDKKITKNTYSHSPFASSLLLLPPQCTPVAFII